MKDQHPIDELFRDQLFNRQVEYDANAWNDAEKMLIDEEKKRKGISYIGSGITCLP